MKTFLLYAALVICALVCGCDVQSGIAKKSLEKYVPTPTPETKVVAEEPINPADVVVVDTTAQGPQITINKVEEAKKIVKCDRYNHVMINGDAKEVKIAGVCSQVMINGDRSNVTFAAAAEIIVNGDENVVQYLKYANGKKPLIKRNGNGNTVLKADGPAPK